jgi:hypothetical protein
MGTERNISSMYLWHFTLYKHLWYNYVNRCIYSQKKHIWKIWVHVRTYILQKNMRFTPWLITISILSFRDYIQWIIYRIYYKVQLYGKPAIRKIHPQTCCIWYRMWDVAYSIHFAGHHGFQYSCLYHKKYLTITKLNSFLWSTSIHKLDICREMLIQSNLKSPMPTRKCSFYIFGYYGVFTQLIYIVFWTSGLLQDLSHAHSPAYNDINT